MKQKNVQKKKKMASQKKEQQQQKKSFNSEEFVKQTCISTKIENSLDDTCFIKLFSFCPFFILLENSVSRSYLFHQRVFFLSLGSPYLRIVRVGAGEDNPKPGLSKTNTCMSLAAHNWANWGGKKKREPGVP